MDFQNCQHGGRRPKWSRWVTNVPELGVLRASCDGLHEHLPWGVSQVGRSWSFATQEEAEYPELLCKRAAAAIAKAATRSKSELGKPKVAKDASVEAEVNNAKEES